MLIKKKHSKNNKHKPNKKIHISKIIQIFKPSYFIYVLLIIFVITIKMVYRHSNNTINKKKDKEDKEDKNIKVNLKLNLTDKEELIYAMNHSEKFITQSAEGILYHPNSMKVYDNPKVTVVIPVYNCQDTIKRAVRSVQNQNIQDFEIILVNDNSKDKSLEVIKELQNEDPRIHIIVNNNNKGTLYSRCVGTLAAKGTYIFPLDNDDMFVDEDVFKVVTDEAINNNMDIIKFRAFCGHGIESLLERKARKKILMNDKIGLTIYQPKLSYYPLIKYKHYLYDVFLWGKCIKADIYKKAINMYGEQNYSIFVIGWEDAIINYIICQIANSFKFIGKYGIFNIFTNKSSYAKTPRRMNHIFELRFLEAAFNFSKNTTEGKETMIYIVTTTLQRNGMKDTLKNEEDQLNYFNTTLKKIMDCPLISDKDKNTMKDTYFSVLGKHFNY
jgi:glycosyltransferase involved in cell wall biosynthesis